MLEMKFLVRLQKLASNVTQQLHDMNIQHRTSNQDTAGGGDGTGFEAM